MTLGPAVEINTRSEKSASLVTIVNPRSSAYRQISLSLHADRDRGQTGNCHPPTAKTNAAGLHRSGSQPSGRFLHAIAVTHQAAGESETSRNVLRLQHRMLTQNLLDRFTGAEIVEVAFDGNAQMTNRRSAVTDIRIVRNPVDRCFRVGHARLHTFPPPSYQRP